MGTTNGRRRSQQGRSADWMRPQRGSDSVRRRRWRRRAEGPGAQGILAAAADADRRASKPENAVVLAGKGRFGVRQ